MYEHECKHCRKRESSRKIEAEEITFYANSFPYLRGVDRGCKAKRVCPWPNARGWNPLSSGFYTNSMFVADLNLTALASSKTIRIEPMPRSADHVL